MGPGRAIGADETLDAGLVDWITGHLAEIYAGLSETPADPATTHRFFAEPGESPSEDASTPGPVSASAGPDIRWRLRSFCGIGEGTVRGRVQP